MDTECFVRHEGTGPLGNYFCDLVMPQLHLEKSLGHHVHRHPVQDRLHNLPNGLFLRHARQQSRYSLDLVDWRASQVKGDYRADGDQSKVRQARTAHQQASHRSELPVLCVDLLPLRVLQHCDRAQGTQLQHHQEIVTFREFHE